MVNKEKKTQEVGLSLHKLFGKIMISLWLAKYKCVLVSSS